MYATSSIRIRTIMKYAPPPELPPTPSCWDRRIMSHPRPSGSCVYAMAPAASLWYRFQGALVLVYPWLPSYNPNHRQIFAATHIGIWIWLPPKCGLPWQYLLTEDRTPPLVLLRWHQPDVPLAHGSKLVTAEPAIGHCRDSVPTPDRNGSLATIGALPIVYRF